MPPRQEYCLTGKRSIRKDRGSSIGSGHFGQVGGGSIGFQLIKISSPGSVTPSGSDRKHRRQEYFLTGKRTIQNDRYRPYRVRSPCSDMWPINRAVKILIKIGGSRNLSQVHPQTDQSSTVFKQDI